MCCHSLALLLLCVLVSTPLVLATSPTMPFPDIPFSDFSDFITSQFSPDISLATVLVLVFSLVENPEFLNLHGRQQTSGIPGESIHTNTSWINIFSKLLLDVRLRHARDELYTSQDGIYLDNDTPHTTNSISLLSRKLNTMIALLKLNAFNTTGTLRHRRRPVDTKVIEPVHLICPSIYQCDNMSCSKYSLTQKMAYTQVPHVALHRGTSVCNYAWVLAGHCSRCNTSYYADHDRRWDPDRQEFYDCHVNSARYLKLGNNVWADRVFTSSVVNAVYSFHASTSAFAEFYNEAFQPTSKMTLRLVWQAFVQETTWMIATDSKVNLMVPENSAIDVLSDLAFSTLGADGKITAADGHACDECSHLQRFGPGEQHLNPQDYAPVRMCVVDGIVMAPTVCTFFLSLGKQTSDMVLALCISQLCCISGQCSD